MEIEGLNPIENETKIAEITTEAAISVISATETEEEPPTIKPTKFTKKQTRENVKRDVKLDDQMVHHYIKTLGSSSMAPEEKLNVMAKNYLMLQRELDKTVTTMKEKEKQRALLQREKENLLKEYNKGVLFQDRLSTVCREQQQHIKSIRNECFAKLREEEDARKATKEEFQKSIANLFSTIEKQNDENLRMREANKSIAVQFKELSEKSSLGEKQLEKLIEQSNIETTLNEVKISKEKLEHSLEKNVMTKELLTAKEELKSLREIIDKMQIREKMLNQQVTLYSDKYSDMHGSMEKSHRIFSTYKSEIDKMSKKMKLLEKDSTEWKVKFERNNLAKMELLTDKQQQDQHIGKLARQLNQLQKLCRTLQAERTSLIEVLKINNIERPPVPDCAPEQLPTIDFAPPPRPQSDLKLDNMTKNCQELKKTLADLQNQMDSYKFGTDKSATLAKEIEPEKNSTPSNTNNNKNSKNKKKKLAAQKIETQTVPEPSEINTESIDDNESMNQRGSDDNDENDVIENGNIAENGTVVEIRSDTISENNPEKIMDVESKDVKTVDVAVKEEENMIKSIVKAEIQIDNDEKIRIEETTKISSPSALSQSSPSPSTTTTTTSIIDELILEMPTEPKVVIEQQTE